MKAPSPPPTPDPYKTAAAQAAANLTVAIGQTYLTNADEERPDASVAFTVKEIVTVQDPSYDSSGNLVGYTPRSIPRFLKTTTLSAKGQQQYDQQQDISIAMNTAALIQAQQLSTKWQIPFSLADLPARSANPSAAAINTTAPTRRAMVREIGQSDDIIREKDGIRRAMLDRLLWQQNMERDAVLVRLRDQGIVPGMQAYEHEMRVYDRQQTDARLQVEQVAGQEHQRLIEISKAKAGFHNDVVEREVKLDMTLIDFANQAAVMSFQASVTLAQLINTVRAQAMQELIAERSQVMNEVSSLMHGGQIQVPQFQGFQAGQIGQTPVMESVYRSAAMDMEKWKTEVAQSNQMMGGIFGLMGNMMPFMMSDRRLKTDIEHVKDDARGFGWYWWRYVWDRPGTRRYGVMAQEVQHIPGAVHRFGEWLAVDYRRLA